MNSRNNYNILLFSNIIPVNCCIFNKISCCELFYLEFDPFFLIRLAKLVFFMIQTMAWDNWGRKKLLRSLGVVSIPGLW